MSPRIPFCGSSVLQILGLSYKTTEVMQMHADYKFAEHDKHRHRAHKD